MLGDNKKKKRCLSSKHEKIVIMIKDGKSFTRREDWVSDKANHCQYSRKGKLFNKMVMSEGFEHVNLAAVRLS